jgi:hypothetical protein
MFYAFYKRHLYYYKYLLIMYRIRIKACSMHGARRYRTKEGGFVLMEGAETGPFMHRRQKRRRTIEGWSPGTGSS